MPGIYQPTTPVEALNKRVEAILAELQKLKEDMIDVLQERFPSGLLTCALDRSHFNILVAKLTREARSSVCISTKEMKFIEETDFLETLRRNTRLHPGSVKILLTTNKGTPDIGDIIARLRSLVNSPKVIIKHNPSRTELRYMTIDKSKVLLVEADHKNAIVINSSEVAQYFDFNFDRYFDRGRDIITILDIVKDIKDPRQEDEEVRRRLTKKRIFREIRVQKRRDK